MSKLVRVQYRVRSVDIRPGDRDWVSEDVAEGLTANRHAFVVGEKDVEPDPEPAPEKPKSKKD
jgi:hypothetical protein